MEQKGKINHSGPWCCLLLGAVVVQHGEGYSARGEG